MARQHDRGGVSPWPWVALLAWIAIIWGHSLMPGETSSAESSIFIKAAQRAVYVVYQQHYPIVDQFAQAHPHFMRSLADAEVMHFYVRKAAHFSEYFVLSLLAFNAARRSFQNPLPGALVIALLWGGVPAVDEWIQLHVPERAGQLRDVLIDMCGYGTGLALSLAVWAVCAAMVALFQLLFGRRDRRSDIGEPTW